MSKLEHDAAVAELREGVSTLNKPWYKSSSELLSRKQIQGGSCLDLCCGNGEFSRILRDRHKMDVVCADYIPFHLDTADKNGYETILLDVDADAEQVDQIAAKPGGLLLVNTPNIAFLAYRLYVLFSGNRPAGEGHHIRFWDYRFLRTNLFLNGFTVTDDARKFYSLPQDALQRSFRGRERLASLVAWMFHGCQLLQHIPFLRGLCCDELTVLAVKDDAPAIGFELNTVQRFLEENSGLEKGKAAVVRLQEARKKGWLDEHLYLGKLVDGLLQKSAMEQSM